AHPDVYDANSLIPLASELTRPLLLIHGLADDNVVAAHTLQLSCALLAAGKPHEVLPLVGVTHLTPREGLAEHPPPVPRGFPRRRPPAAAPVRPPRGRQATRGAPARRRHPHDAAGGRRRAPPPSPAGVPPPQPAPLSTCRNATSVAGRESVGAASGG